METNEVISVFFDAMDGLNKVEAHLWERYLEAELEIGRDCRAEFDGYYRFSVQRNKMLQALDFLLVKHRRRTGLPAEITRQGDI